MCRSPTASREQRRGETWCFLSGSRPSPRRFCLALTPSFPCNSPPVAAKRCADRDRRPLRDREVQEIQQNSRFEARACSEKPSSLKLCDGNGLRLFRPPFGAGVLKIFNTASESGNAVCAPSEKSFRRKLLFSIDLRLFIYPVEIILREWHGICCVE